MEGIRSKDSFLVADSFLVPSNTLFLDLFHLDFCHNRFFAFADKSYNLDLQGIHHNLSMVSFQNLLIQKNYRKLFAMKISSLQCSIFRYCMSYTV